MDYNKTYEDEWEKRAAILAEILGEFGAGGFIQGPIAFHYGVHTKIGRSFFANFNLTVQDERCLCYAKPVHIGSNCWIGADPGKEPAGNGK